MIDKETRKAKFVEEITAYVATKRNPAEAMTPEEFAALDSLGRLMAQRQSLMDNVARYCALHRNADVGLALLVVNTFLADNPKGACWIGNDRLQRFLSRSDRSIALARRRLEEDQLVLVDRPSGDVTFTTPWIYRGFGQSCDPLTWILDVRAPTDGVRRPGRPPKENPASRGAEFSGKPPKPASPLFGNTPEAGRQIPPKPASPNTTYDTTYVEEDDCSACARDGLITDQDSRVFNELFNRWGRGPDDPMFNVTDRETTDQFLADELRVHAAVDPEIVQAALIASLNQTRAKAIEAKRGRSGGSAMLSYLHQVMKSEIDRLVLQRAKMQAEARTEQAVAEKRLSTRVASVAQRSGPMSASDLIKASRNRARN